MADATVQAALANEARRSELKIKIAGLRGAMNCTASIVDRLTVVNSDAGRQLTEATAALAALELGAGAGITADYGFKSTITQMLEGERDAAKSACIDFVQAPANVACTEAQAAAAWDSAAIAFHADIVLTVPMQPGLPMGQVYRANLYKQGLILANTWEAQRTWIQTTPKQTIMDM